MINYILKNRNIRSNGNVRSNNVKTFVLIKCKKILQCHCSDNNINEITAQNLVQWIEKNDGKVNKGIKISKNESDGHYLEAREEIRKGEMLIQLPEKCQLSSNKLLNNKTYKKLEKDIPKELWAAKLAMILLQERTKFENSEYWMYIKTLPQGIAGIPIFYSSECIKQINYEPIIYQIKKRCEWLINFYNKNKLLLNELFNKKEIDINVFAWAFAIATSRAFKINENISFLPMIDLCNHSFNSNSYVDINITENKVQLIASSDINNGDIIYINYGNMSNDEYLLDYGFIINHNPFDKIELKFDMNLINDGRYLAKIMKNGDNNIYLTNEKSKLLKKLNLIPTSSSVHNLKIVFNRQNLIDERLIIAIRIISLNSVLDDIKQYYDKINDDNEIITLRTIIGILLRTLLNFSCTADDDSKILDNNQFSDPNEKLTITFRLEKKKLIIDTINDLSDKLKQLL